MCCTQHLEKLYVYVYMYIYMCVMSYPQKRRHELYHQHVHSRLHSHFGWHVCGIYLATLTPACFSGIWFLKPKARSFSRVIMVKFHWTMKKEKATATRIAGELAVCWPQSPSAQKTLPRFITSNISGFHFGCACSKMSTSVRSVDNKARFIQEPFPVGQNKHF